MTYFTFSPAIGGWGSHTEERLGSHSYPFFKALALYNQYGAGQLLAIETTSAPKWDFPAYEALDNTAKVKRAALPQAPLVRTYASVTGDRVAVFLISRKLDNFPVTGDDGFNPVTLKLPFTKARSSSLHKLVGDPRVDDRFEEHTKVQTIPLDPKTFKGTPAVNAATGADARGLPPASIFCYVFEGTDAAKPSLPPVARFEIPETIVAGELLQAQVLWHINTPVHGVLACRDVLREQMCVLLAPNGVLRFTGNGSYTSCRAAGNDYKTNGRATRTDHGPLWRSKVHYKKARRIIATSTLRNIIIW